MSVTRKKLGWFVLLKDWLSRPDASLVTEAGLITDFICSCLVPSKVNHLFVHLDPRLVIVK
jgi:hypothetical protein